jgi:hypothetical protein
MPVSRLHLSLVVVAGRSICRPPHPLHPTGGDRPPPSAGLNHDRAEPVLLHQGRHPRSFESIAMCVSDQDFYRSCPCPARSRWGPIQTKSELAPGVWSVSTAGHGGIKLSRERNAAVPAYLRREGGWYEEDCEWAIAAVVHHHRRTRRRRNSFLWFEIGAPRRTRTSVSTLRGWRPRPLDDGSGLVHQVGQPSSSTASSEFRSGLRSMPP